MTVLPDWYSLLIFGVFCSAAGTSAPCFHTIEEMKNSTKYKFVPLFKQIKVNRALVKAFDEYESLQCDWQQRICFAAESWESLVSVCVRVCECQGGHGLCQLHTCRVFIDGVYAKE